MKKHIALMILTCLLAACSQSPSNETRIGIVIPLEHHAMQEIVAGFSDTLKKLYPHPVILDVKNAQNDMNLQRSIIQQESASDDKILVTIGLAATQMSASMVHEKPIIGLAASLSDKDHAGNIALVHDEIAPIKLLTLVKTAYPDIKHITLIHSSADKVFPEVKESVLAGKQMGITILPIMATTLPDLTSVTANIPEHTQAILVLKDHLIVSGISLLAKKAHERHIPLITLDQGSVAGGADFALGVHERETGAEGAKLAMAILNKQSPHDLPIVYMTQLTVFANEHVFSEKKPIEEAAKKLAYSFEIIKSTAN